MEKVLKLSEAIRLLDTIPCTGKEQMTRMLTAMQRIADVANQIASENTIKEDDKKE